MNLRLKVPSGQKMYLITYVTEKNGEEKAVPISSRQVLSDSVVLSRRRVEQQLIDGLIEDLSPNEMIARIFG